MPGLASGGCSLCSVLYALIIVVVVRGRLELLHVNLSGTGSNKLLHRCCVCVNIQQNCLCLDILFDVYVDKFTICCTEDLLASLNNILKTFKMSRHQ